MQLAPSPSRIGSLLVLAVATAACSSGGGGDAAVATGGSTLSVALMDAPVDGVTEVKVAVTKLWLKPAGGPATELPLAQAPLVVDLLEHGSDNPALLIDDAQIPAGDYEWLAMDVAADFDNVYDSYAMTLAGGQEEIRVPSGRVRLVDGFTVDANRAVELVFDWDLRHGLVDPPGQPGYLLKPAFRVLDVHTYGELHGTVAENLILDTGDPNGCLTDDADPAIGNVVYVFAGSDVVPDDIDDVAPEPIATIAVEQDAAGDYVYRSLVAPGDYTVAFTCQAGNDDPAVDETGTPEEIEFLPALNRTIAAGEDVAADF